MFALYHANGTDIILKKGKAKKIDRDTVQFTGIERAVVNERHYTTEISERFGPKLEAPVKIVTRFRQMSEATKRYSNPSPFKRISRDDFEKMGY